MPRVEVIVCTYNGGAFVTEQLRSVIDQTVPVQKISVYDDRSADDTLAHVNAYIASLPPDKRALFHVVVNGRNLGFANNFMNAVSNATGDVLFLCDQDDVWEPQKVERLLGVLSRYDVDLAFSDGKLIDAAGRELRGATVLESYGLGESGVTQFKDRAFQLLLKRNYINGAAAAIRRSVAQAALPLPPQMPHDYWLAIWSALHNGVAGTPEKLYQYRQHAQNVIGAGSANPLYIWLGIWRQPRQPRELDLLRWEAVAERIAALGKGDELEQARAKVTWLKRIVHADGDTRRKAAEIAKSVFNGNYRNYSTGDSFLRDLVSLVR